MEKRMNKEELINLMESVAIDKEEFVVLSSSALVLRDIFPDAGDLDIAVTEKGLAELKTNYNLVQKENGWYIVNDKVECVRDDMENKKEKIGKYYLQDIYGYLKHLESSSREKDKARINLVRKGFMKQEFITNLLQYYNIGELINEPIILTGGITNKLYKISTTKGIYVIKLLSSNDIVTIEKSEKISFLAQKNGVKALYALKVNNRFVNKIGNYNVLLYNFYNGRVLLTKELSISHIEALAKELSKLHSIECHQQYEKKCLRNDYNELFLLAIKKDEACFNYFKENIDLLNEIYNKVYENYLKLSKQSSYVHRDYNRKNVLWNNDDFKIIDFETATIGNPSIDFFNSLWFLTNDYQIDKLECFVKAYFKDMQLKDDYKVGAYAALIEECNWLYFSLKRSLGLNTKKDDEILLGKNSVAASLKEIINCYNKIDDMIKAISKYEVIV